MTSTKRCRITGRRTTLRIGSAYASIWSRRGTKSHEKEKGTLVICGQETHYEDRRRPLADHPAVREGPIGDLDTSQRCPQPANDDSRVRRLGLRRCSSPAAN